MPLIGKIKDKIIFFWKIFLDYLFPKECGRCHHEGEYLCSSCFSQIEYLPKNYCFLCNRPIGEYGICQNCQKSSGIDSIIIATKYNNFVGQLVEKLKYQFIEELSLILAKILNKQIENWNFSRWLEDFVIIPIPLHEKRFIERGFNQAELIAKSLRMPYNNLVRTDLLRRQKYTDQQAKLDRLRRFENVGNAFMATEGHLPTKVILLDDVLTTGATFISATRTLKERGVETVICLAICHG